MKLTIGFSPCPNDTFIFDALINGKMDTQGFEFEARLEDVETLNEMAFAGTLDITKLSYSALLHTTNHYVLLYTGSALGQGVGPLLVAKSPMPQPLGSGLHVAIPGQYTTANLLFTLAQPHITHKTSMLFSDIENAVIEGKVDAGLVIHESRFTYAAKGLHKLMDLGEWWEATTGAAIPLGGIAIKRSHSADLAAQVDKLIAQSIAHAWEHYPSLSPYVTNHAYEMDEAVMRSHINLYVNEYTSHLGEKGIHAINTLFQYAHAAGIVKENNFMPFYR